ncbi:hypothetical protein OROGR_010586 [Orobanche gracilis]
MNSHKKKKFTGNRKCGILQQWLPWIVREINKRTHDHYAKCTIDSMLPITEKDIIWRPYEGKECPLPGDRNSVRDLVPLFCYYAVVHHKPHHCSRQFRVFNSYDLIPNWDDYEIEIKERKGGGRQDYFSMHDKEITAWRTRNPAEEFMQYIGDAEDDDEDESDGEDREVEDRDDDRDEEEENDEEEQEDREDESDGEEEDREEEREEDRENDREENRREDREEERDDRENDREEREERENDREEEREEERHEPSLIYNVADGLRRSLREKKGVPSKHFSPSLIKKRKSARKYKAKARQRR